VPHPNGSSDVPAMPPPPPPVSGIPLSQRRTRSRRRPLYLARAGDSRMRERLYVAFVAIKYVVGTGQHISAPTAKFGGPTAALSPWPYLRVHTARSSRIDLTAYRKLVQPGGAGHGEEFAALAVRYVCPSVHFAARTCAFAGPCATRFRLLWCCRGPRIFPLSFALRELAPATYYFWLIDIHGGRTI